MTAARIGQISALVVALGIASAIALARYEIRPRPAALDPTTVGLPVASVRIPSGSGSMLAGWFIRGTGQGGVLLLHGAKSNRNVLVERMRMLADAGYSSLAIDFQAHGESPGDRITLGSSESLDARSALDWLRAQIPGQRLAALGISMGGAALLIGEPIEADAVIIESTYADLTGSISNRLALRLGPLGRALSPPVMISLSIAAGVDIRRLRPIDSIAQLRAPIFIMTGADDKKTTVEESRALFARAHTPKYYWEVPGAGHVDLAWAGGAEYRKRLLCFLGAALRGENC